MASTAPQRRRMSADARRAQLVTSAREVFLRSGLTGTTIRDISDAAQVNVALLYRHFDSKEQIFDAAVAEPLEDALSGLVTQASQASAYIGRPDVQRAQVVRVVTELLTVMAEITPLIGVVLFSDRGAQFYTEHLGPAIATIAEATEISRRNVGHRRYDPEVVATMLVGTCLLSGLRELYGTRVDRTALARELTGLLFDGIVPR